jgi:peptide deformylase
MALLPIRLYPDSVLRRRCRPVETFDDELKKLADDMVETMHAAPGIGLAAPQVGVDLRLAVVDLSVGKSPEDLLVLVNPVIRDSEGSQVDAEGCLSIPDYSDRVERPLRVRLEAQDLEGEPFQGEAEELLARAICHELDHLDGVLFVDHLRGLRRERARRFLRKMSREQAPAASEMRA